MDLQPYGLRLSAKGNHLRALPTYSASNFILSTMSQGQMPTASFAPLSLGPAQQQIVNAQQQQSIATPLVTPPAIAQGNPTAMNQADGGDVQMTTATSYDANHHYQESIALVQRVRLLPQSPNGAVLINEVTRLQHHMQQQIGRT